jgi:hypothetical protein
MACELHFSSMMIILITFIIELWKFCKGSTPTSGKSGHTDLCFEGFDMLGWVGARPDGGTEPSKLFCMYEYLLTFHSTLQTVHVKSYQ